SRMKEVYTVEDLRNWREVNPPIRLGVAGDPVEHSVSPQIQNAALRECGIAAQYSRFRVPAEELRDWLQLVRERDFIGVNLTLPHKIGGLQLMDKLERSARENGAVNTVAIIDGK